MLSSVSPPSCSPSSSHHHSNQAELELDSHEKRNWTRLQQKIRVIFQTYDIHVGEGALLNLKNCPLASFSSPQTFSPAVSFLFVESCEFATKGKNPLTTNNFDIGRVSAKTEIIITNVHHIDYFHRVVQMAEYNNNNSFHKSNLTDNNVHLYGLEHAAKILNGLIKTSSTSGTRTAASQQNPRVPVTYTITPQTGCSLPFGLLTEFSHGLLISGPVGCGKVVVVRETAKKLGAHLLSFNPCLEESASSIAHFCQQLTDTFTKCLATASRYQTVLLFPRIHLLFGGDSPSANPTSLRNNNKARVLHHLCKLFDNIPPGVPLTVVATTDKPYLVPLQLRRAGRLEKEVVRVFFISLPQL